MLFPITLCASGLSGSGTKENNILPGEGSFFYKIFNRRLFLSACSNRKTKLKIDPPPPLQVEFANQDV